MKSSGDIQLEASWLELLAGEFEQPYMRSLRQFLRKEKMAGKTIYPAGPNIFSALDLTPVSHVKVVIIGQDPYHGPGQAHGLSFSVPAGVAIPPSLMNIYKEIGADLGKAPAATFSSGSLLGWAGQGVLLLNAVLTVEHSKAGSHQGKGWERFTDAIVAALNRQCEGLVFLLWGGYAQKKGAIVDADRHCVLRAPHPSPLSAHRGFLGCRHFSQANQYLASVGKTQIDWAVHADG